MRQPSGALDRARGKGRPWERLSADSEDGGRVQPLAVGAWHTGAFPRFNSNGVESFSQRLVWNAYLGRTSDYENNLNEVVADVLRAVMNGTGRNRVAVGDD